MDYDSQAVMTDPKGEVSNFYYKSKINCEFNDIGTEDVNVKCYNRGANEIGSCVEFSAKKALSRSY